MEKDRTIFHKLLKNKLQRRAPLHSMFILYGFSGFFENDFSCAINASLSVKRVIHAVTWQIFAVQNVESAYATNAI